MSAMREAMYDIAEELHLEFDNDADFDKIAKVATHRHRLPYVAARCDSLRKVTRLWNWIDNQDDSDYLFGLLAIWCPWAFEDASDINTMRFTY